MEEKIGVCELNSFDFLSFITQIYCQAENDLLDPYYYIHVFISHTLNSYEYTGLSIKTVT